VACLNRLANIGRHYCGVSIKIQTSDHLFEEVSALRPSIEQGYLQVRSINGDY
jgi:hypothetical protein